MGLLIKCSRCDRESVLRTKNGCVVVEPCDCKFAEFHEGQRSLLSCPAIEAVAKLLPRQSVLSVNPETGENETVLDIEFASRLLVAALLAAGENNE